jgi:autotransporter-associated beta strand protein
VRLSVRPSQPQARSSSRLPASPASPSDDVSQNFFAPGYEFELSGVHTLEITGEGIQAPLNPANAPTFNVSSPQLLFENSSTAGAATLNAFNTGPIAFLNTSTAGNATINSGVADSTDAFTGGFVFFRDSSTAGNAKITSFFASNIEFQNTSNAGNATITTIAGEGGSIFFEDASSAGHATITMVPGGELSFAPAFFGNPNGTATAGDATIINSGTTNFFEGSSAGNATITNSGTFFNTSSADNAIITSSGLIEFHDQSSAGAATFNTHFGVTNFFDTSTAGNAAFTVIEGNMNFNDNSSGGTATIIAGRPVSENGGFDAGFIKFFNTSTAGQATISSLDGSSVEFHDSSTAGTATLIVGESGFLEFVDSSSGDQARVINNAGGEVRIADLTTGGTSFGSIEGAGTFNLGSKQLTVGSNNASTTVSGVIEDHFPGDDATAAGGSLVKVGAGTLTLTGVDPYTGGTTVSGGALVVGDFANPSAALSGGGPISVGSGGTLGGYGSVIGDVTNSGVIAPGSAAPGLSGSPMGAFTIKGNYTGAGGTMTINTVLGGDASPSDRMVISGGMASGNTIVHVTNVGGVGAETTNGIPVVNAISGATTTPGAFALPAGELRAGAFDYDLLRGGISGSSPNDWFLRSDFVSEPTTPEPPVTPPVVLPVPPFPADPPPNPLPPGVAFPIIGPELATYGVVQPLARHFWKAMLMSSRFRVASFWAICLSSAFSASASCVKSARSTASCAVGTARATPRTTEYGVQTAQRYSQSGSVQSPVLPRPCPSGPSRTGRQRRSLWGASPSQPPSRLRSHSGGAQLRRGSRPAHPARSRRQRRPGDDRRGRRRPARSRLAAPIDRRRPAGEHPVQPHDP